MNKLLKDALDELTALHLFNGVQPSDLADAMYETPYLEFKTTKTVEHLTVELSFIDEYEETANTVKMKYVYSLDRKLQRIDQKIGSKKFATQWCRKTATSDAITKVESAFRKMRVTDKKISEIMSTLPSSARSQVRARLSLVA
ncbi:hypothetical protein A2T76_17770 [Pseudomonas brenneri]|jgi:hypothetical protein|nr:hypothetical protein A2T76_17770 [Pseudomonas brenneri]